MYRLALVVAVLAVALVVTALSAGASDEPTRAEYVAHAESICHSQLTPFRQNTANLRASARKLNKSIVFFAPNAQQKADSPPLKKLFRPVGRFYRLGAAYIDKVTDSLSQLGVPSADSETITKWLASRRVLAHDYRLLGKAYPQRKLGRIYKRFLALAKAPFPPRALMSFGFQYCYGQHANPFSAS